MTQREELKKYQGQWIRCRALIKNFGTTPRVKGCPPLTTLLLVDIVHVETDTILTDHMWFKAGKWSDNLMIGDIIEFDAFVKSYTKGYLGRREIVDLPISVDWKLCRVKNVVKHYKHYYIPYQYIGREDYERVEHWCVDNCKGRYEILDWNYAKRNFKVEFKFQLELDAVLFKLFVR